MSDANVRLVQSLYHAFKRGDIAPIIAALTPDIDWQVHGDPKDFPTIGRWKGPNGAADFFRKVAETLDVVEFSPQEFQAAGDTVVALGRYDWKVRATGKPAGGEWCHVFTFKNGKVSRFREYSNTASFAAAARL
jgi:ketosteroid isomerase-like protein